MNLTLRLRLLDAEVRKSRREHDFISLKWSVVQQPLMEPIFDAVVWTPNAFWKIHQLVDALKIRTSGMYASELRDILMAKPRYVYAHISERDWQHTTHLEVRRYFQWEKSRG